MAQPDDEVDLSAGIFKEIWGMYPPSIREELFTQMSPALQSALLFKLLEGE